MEDFEVITVYLEGLDDKENRFIKEQLKRKLGDGMILTKYDLEVGVPTSYLITAAKQGGIMKKVKVLKPDGKILKSYVDADLVKYDEENPEDLKKLHALLEKGEVFVALTQKGWQDTLQELIEQSDD